jgi:hypothetical protein
MSWWDRYQAWQPESQWDRYQARRLESRARYVATAVGPRALIVFFVFGVFSGYSAGKALLLTAISAVLCTLVYGWVWYPRAKAKSQRTSVPAHTTHV